MLFPRAIGLHYLPRHVFRNPQYVIPLVLPLQRRPPYGVNRLSLFVHYIVVFQQMLARVEVLRFYRFLRVLNAVRNEL